MKDPALAGRILAAMVQAVDIPVTVKFRAGWDENHRNAVEFAKTAEAAGVAAVAVHGRTRTQFYAGHADWDIIRRVKEAVSIPVWGNGDIFTWQDGLRMFDETGCDGVMIARGANGNPWIFTQLRAALAGRPVPDVSLAERLAMIREHARALVAFKGEYVAVREMRSHASAYLKGLPRAASYRGKINSVNTLAELEAVVEEYGSFVASSGRASDREA
jgi:tRNA-dihydrouridine synthase B